MIEEVKYWTEVSKKLSGKSITDEAQEIYNGDPHYLDCLLSVDSKSAIPRLIISFHLSNGSTMGIALELSSLIIFNPKTNRLFFWNKGYLVSFRFLYPIGSKESLAEYGKCFEECYAEALRLEEISND